MKYVDGFVFVVKKNKIDAYKKMAKDASKMFKRLGAIGYYECMGDDLNPETGGMKMLPFPKLTKPKKDETIWFSFIIYKSKAARDKANKNMMKEMEKEMKKTGKKMEMPFDMKRMSYGGFKVIVE